MEGEMENRRTLDCARRILICAAVALLGNAAWAASSTKLIYSFAGDDDGEYTDTELVIDRAGNLYGTSVQGGAFGGGTVFRVTTGGVHTVLYNFTGGADGGEPYKGVTLDAEGNLYGTTVAGGGGSCDGGCGVVFKLTKAGETWTQSVIHTFTGGDDGAGPGSPVAFDKYGNMYGTTPIGGANGSGVVYQLRLNGSGGWNFEVIHAFVGGPGVTGGSAGGLLVSPSGRKIYGTCTVGGANGVGYVYEISRHAATWQFTTLYSFKDYPDGALPYSGLIADKMGNLYGTTYYAGENDLGTVYQLRHHDGTWTESVLYSFKGGPDGDSPIGTLAGDAEGNLYGTTSDGGSIGCNCGTIFKLTPGLNGAWTETVAYRFLGAPRPAFAYNGMVGDGAGNFYGATVHGGRSDEGAIYKFTP
jgi:uncharacterized repeat protein (TIGR03803 family)